MGKPEKNEAILNVIHEHKAVKGGKLVPVFLRVRYEKENMEAFLSAVGISKESLEIYEREALNEALEWGEAHPGEEEGRAGDVLMESFCELLKNAKNPMKEPLKYGLKIHRKGGASDDDDDRVRYSITL
jgi:hypothetical protein